MSIQYSSSSQASCSMSWVAVCSAVAIVCLGSYMVAECGGHTPVHSHTPTEHDKLQKVENLTFLISYEIDMSMNFSFKFGGVILM